MKTALVYGAWGQNIGNAFFNLGGEYLLRQAGHEVYLIQDQPAYATFRNEQKGNFDNAFDMIADLDVDLVVLQGPLFTKNFGNIWRETLGVLKRRGVKWGILSGSFRKFTTEEQQVARDVFDFYPPHFLSTRDRATFDILAGDVTRSRAGICSAFFLPRYYAPPRMVSAKEGFISLCFDHYPEPDFIAARDGVVEIGDTTFDLEYPQLGERLADKSKAHAYIGHFLDRRRLPGELAGRTVLRPEHRTSPHIPAKIYRQKNAIAWDEPYTYLTAYANSALTISDRVHACVATLAYGGRAMLHNPGTKRHALFESVQAPEIAHRSQSVDQSFLDVMHDETVSFLTEL